MDPRTQLYEQNILAAQIEALNKQINEGCFVFRSNIEKFTMIVSGNANGTIYTKLFDVKQPQHMPPEIKTMFEQWTTRLISERNNLQEQLKRMQSGAAAGGD